MPKIKVLEDFPSLDVSIDKSLVVEFNQIQFSDITQKAFDGRFDKYKQYRLFRMFNAQDKTKKSYALQIVCLIPNQTFNLSSFAPVEHNIQFVVIDGDIPDHSTLLLPKGTPTIIQGNIGLNVKISAPQKVTVTGTIGTSFKIDVPNNLVQVGANVVSDIVRANPRTQAIPLARRNPDLPARPPKPRLTLPPASVAFPMDESLSPRSQHSGGPNLGLGLGLGGEAGLGAGAFKVGASAIGSGARVATRVEGPGYSARHAAVDLSRPRHQPQALQLQSPKPQEKMIAMPTYVITNGENLYVSSDAASPDYVLNEALGTEIYKGKKILVLTKINVSHAMPDNAVLNLPMPKDTNRYSDYMYLVDCVIPANLKLRFPILDTHLLQDVSENTSLLIVKPLYVHSNLGRGVSIQNAMKSLKTIHIVQNSKVIATHTVYGNPVDFVPKVLNRPILAPDRPRVPMVLGLAAPARSQKPRVARESEAEKPKNEGDQPPKVKKPIKKAKLRARSASLKFDQHKSVASNLPLLEQLKIDAKNLLDFVAKYRAEVNNMDVREDDDLGVVPEGDPLVLEGDLERKEGKEAKEDRDEQHGEVENRKKKKLPSKYKPLPHQLDMMEQLAKKAWLRGKALAVNEQATGTGKTNEIIDIFRAIAGEETIKHKMLFIVPSLELIKQTVERFESIINKRFKVVSLRDDGNKKLTKTKIVKKFRDNDVIVMTIQTLCSKISGAFIPLEQVTFFVIDEAHSCLSDQRARFIQRIVKKYGCRVLAVTATPFLESHEDRTVYELFGFKRDGSDNPITPFGVQEACLTNRISPVVTCIIYPKDRGKLKFNYRKKINMKEASELTNIASYNRMFVDIYMNKGDPETGCAFRGKKAMVFCCDIKHANDMMDEFNKVSLKESDPELYAELNARYKARAKADYIQTQEKLFNKNPQNRGKVFDPKSIESDWENIFNEQYGPLETARSVHSKLPKAEREKILKKAKLGGILVLTNVDVLVQGYDDPEVEVILRAALTSSSRKVIQPVGRGLRLDPNNPNKILYVIEVNWGNRLNIKFFHDCCLRDKNSFMPRYSFPEARVKQCRSSHTPAQSIRSRPVIDIPDKHSLDAMVWSPTRVENRALGSCVEFLETAISKLKHKLDIYRTHLQRKPGLALVEIPEEELQPEPDKTKNQPKQDSVVSNGKPVAMNEEEDEEVIDIVALDEVGPARVEKVESDNVGAGSGNLVSKDTPADEIEFGDSIREMPVRKKAKTATENDKSPKKDIGKNESEVHKKGSIHSEDRDTRSRKKAGSVSKEAGAGSGLVQKSKEKPSLPNRAGLRPMETDDALEEDQKSNKETNLVISEKIGQAAGVLAEVNKVLELNARERKANSELNKEKEVKREQEREQKIKNLSEQLNQILERYQKANEALDNLLAQPIGLNESNREKEIQELLEIIGSIEKEFQVVQNLYKELKKNHSDEKPVPKKIKKEKGKTLEKEQTSKMDQEKIVQWLKRSQLTTLMSLAKSDAPLEVIKFFIKTNPGCLDEREVGTKNSVLHILTNGDLARFNWFLSHCLSIVNVQNVKGYTVLHRLVQSALSCFEHSHSYYYYLECIINFLFKSSNLDVNLQDLEGNTPLHLILAKSGSMTSLQNELAIFLMAFGAKYDVKNNNGDTPFDLLGDKDIVVAVAGSIDNPIDFSETFLNKNNIRSVEVDRKLNQDKYYKSINQQDVNGLSVLHRVAKLGRFSILRRCLEMGANPHLRDKSLATPIFFILYSRSPSMIGMLKLFVEKYKGSVDVCNISGNTPLNMALNLRLPTDVILYLVERTSVKVVQDKTMLVLRDFFSQSIGVLIRETWRYKSTVGYIRILEALFVKISENRDDNALKEVFSQCLQCLDKGVRDKFYIQEGKLTFRKELTLKRVAKYIRELYACLENFFRLKNVETKLLNESLDNLKSYVLSKNTESDPASVQYFHDVLADVPNPNSLFPPKENPGPQPVLNHLQPPAQPQQPPVYVVQPQPAHSLFSLGENPGPQPVVNHPQPQQPQQPLVGARQPHSAPYYGGPGPMPGMTHSPYSIRGDGSRMMSEPRLPPQVLLNQFQAYRQSQPPVNTRQTHPGHYFGGNGAGSGAGSGAMPGMTYPPYSAGPPLPQLLAPVPHLMPLLPSPALAHGLGNGAGSGAMPGMTYPPYSVGPPLAPIPPLERLEAEDIPSAVGPVGGVAAMDVTLDEPGLGDNDVASPDIDEDQRGHNEYGHEGDEEDSDEVSEASEYERKDDEEQSSDNESDNEYGHEGDEEDSDEVSEASEYERKGDEEDCEEEDRPARAPFLPAFQAAAHSQANTLQSRVLQPVAERIGAGIGIRTEHVDEEEEINIVDNEGDVNMPAWYPR